MFPYLTLFPPTVTARENILKQGIQAFWDLTSAWLFRLLLLLPSFPFIIHVQAIPYYSTLFHHHVFLLLLFTINGLLNFFFQTIFCWKHCSHVTEFSPSPSIHTKTFCNGYHIVFKLAKFPPLFPSLLECVLLIYFFPQRKT